jgi:MoxR-like ATPase
MHVKEKIKTILRALIAFLWRTHTKQRVDSVQEIHPKRTNKKMKERISKLLEALNEGLYERENELKLALLSSIAGESIFFLGPPGVAKSMVARRLKYAYKDAKVFEYLMSRFSTPDEIFGPVSISELKKDRYVRVIDGYLPAAEVVFLDEIWKAGPSIQNALLTVINEKVFRNGGEEIKVPMKALISASNELPAKDQGLEALWDRFLVRVVVEGVKKDENFEKMITENLNPSENDVDEKDKITSDSYKEWSKQIDDIIVPENVRKVILKIREYINDYNDGQEDSNNKIYVSDRRWRKIIRLLRTSAFLNDRAEIDLMDCFLIKDCIWDEKSHESEEVTQQDSVYSYVKNAIELHGYTFELDFAGIREEIDALKEDITKETEHVKDDRTEVLVDSSYGDYYEILGLNKCDYYTRNVSVPLLISHSDYNSLKTTDSPRISIRYYSKDYYNNVQEEGKHNVRKGKDEFHIIIDNTQYKLKTRIDGNKVKKTRQPHKSVEETWDTQVSTFCETIDTWKENLERYRSKDLEHIRNNIFVKSEYAVVVEKSILGTSDAINEIESENKQIQKSYKDLKEKDEVIS